MRAVLVSLIAGLASPALLSELPDPQWIVLAAVFGLALAMQWQSGLNSNLLIGSHQPVGSNVSASVTLHQPVLLVMVRQSRFVPIAFRVKAMIRAVSAVLVSISPEDNTCWNWFKLAAG